MPLLNFKKQFAPKVESGEKLQTIRAKRKDGRNPHVGDKLYLYAGLRTKSCRKIGEAVCTSVNQITIDDHGINIDGIWLSLQERDKISQEDGFDDFSELIQWFRKEHGLPFEGLLYKW